MSGRITAARVARTAQGLSDAQTRVVEHVEHARVLSGQQLRRLRRAESSSAQRRLRAELAELVEWRALGRLERRVGGVRAGSDSYVYALDVLGQRLVDSAARRQWRRPWTPTPRILDHALAVAEVYVQLHEAQAAQTLELLDFTAEPGCWRTYVSAGGGRSVLKPDAHFVVAAGDLEEHRFLEVDRATESAPWILTKAQGYGRYWQTGREEATTGVFPRVLWSVPDQRRQQQLEAAISRLPPTERQLHQVATADCTIQTLGSGGTS